MTQPNLVKQFFNVAKLMPTFVRRKCHIWLPAYVRTQIQRRKQPASDAGPIDVMVAMVDHFEPSRREGAAGVKKVEEWCAGYEQIASRHRDSDGVMPQHTWFYRYDYPNFDCLNILSKYVHRHLGEIEFHLHHGNDTSESFAQTIREGVTWFNTGGAMLTAEPTPKRGFAYIAGNWALDNGRGDASMSGVNNELEILARAGCFADFTFPAYGVNAQPRMVNSIYYATDTPAAKSYDTGVPVQVGVPPTGDLMIFEGPLYVDWGNGYIEHSALETFAPYMRERVAYWLRAGVHVAGRPEWIFVKLHTHGMQSRGMFLGPQLEQLLSDLETQYRGGKFRLHYVTAREAYNIAKAAEAGKTGDPNLYRDFIFKQPANRLVHCNSPYELESWSPERVSLRTISPSDNTRVELNNSPVAKLEGGQISRVELHCARGEIQNLRIEGDGDCRITLAAPAGPGSETQTATVRMPALYCPRRIEATP